jgi:ribonuclease HI
MKTIRNSILCLSALFLTASLLHGQELSKYRGFSIGTSLANVLKLSDQKLADVKTMHARPMLIQELTWWPPSSIGAYSRPDNVEQILFSFSNGELYKISVTYDRSSTEGLTALDMVKSISAKYGPATNVESEIDPVMNALYNMKQNPVASWEDSQYFFNLIRSSYIDRFGLVIYSKRANAEAELGIAEAVKLEEQERPEKEASQKRKEADDLEGARQKNQKSFHP